MQNDDPDGTRQRPGTRLAGAGRSRSTGSRRFVNPPVIHASTILFDSVEEMLSGKAEFTYGRRGTPTIRALEGAISDISGAFGTVLCPSGLNAIATALLAYVGSGDHILVPDTIYQPGRHFVDRVLTRMGVAVTYYDPTAGAGIAELIRPETKLIYLESPGSLTFEMQDLPAICAVARGRDLVTVVDNTWATPLFCDVLGLGADVALLSATKYVGGHSDVMLGTVSANERCWKRLRNTHGAMGVTAGPDDINLCLRGLRTLEVRLLRHQQSALAVATWLSERPEVERVLYPALPGDPGHALWQRDMSGAAGVFSFILDGWSDGQAARFLDSLQLFGLGYSWGGYESLAIPADHEIERTARRWGAAGPMVRLSIGLEAPEDLIADLAAGLETGAAG